MAQVYKTSKQAVQKIAKASVVIGLLNLTACGLQLGSQASNQEENITQATLSAGVGQLSVNVNKYSANKLVCDPFNNGGSGTISYEHGIKADLFYKTASQPRMYSSEDYVNFAKKSDQVIFMSDMNVPTRMFTEGFTVANGATLNNDEEEKLIEYFGLKMTTNIVLSDSDDDGWYEFALLSDDGTTMKIKSGTDAPDTVLIDNDGDHPTRMGCTTQSVYLRKGVMLPVEVTYYQGPRYHIANVLMFRKAEQAGQDPSCGLTGNSTFFDPNNNSAPLPAYNALLNRGWKVLTSDNFMVSRNSTDYNPCVQGTNPVISNFSILEVFMNGADLTWSTDIPATDQVQITNTSTGVVTTTTSDNVLRTTHQIRLSNLQSGTTYKVQAISVSEDLGRSISSELTLVIP